LKPLKNLSNNYYNIDFSKVDWSPFRFGGAQFNINDFIYTSDSLKILPSKSAKIIPLIVTIIFGSLPLLFYKINNQKPHFVVLFVVGVFISIFIISYIRVLIKVEIDKSNGSIKKGISLKRAKIIGQISDIEFIQIVEQLIPQKKNQYFSYEINLVLKNRNRISITDHADFEEIKKEAQKLKLFLGVPIFTKSKKSAEIIELS
jgi:hypothetical protein